MAQFVAEVISDKPGYGNATAALSNIASSFLGGGQIPIGTVEWAASADPTLPAATGFAAPLLPWSTTMPVEGEFILVFTSPSPTQTSGDSVAESFFYLGPIGIDGDKNRNAAPGFMNRTTTLSLPIPPIYKMTSKQMPPIQPMNGDTIIQDRNGSIIRMSSTLHPLEASKAKNSLWKRPGYVPLTPGGIGPSFVPGQSGNPIMAMTVGPIGKASNASAAVGQFTGTKTFWEKLTKSGGDRSSIILTSDQQVTYDFQRKSWKFKNQIFAKGIKFVTTGANKASRGAKAAKTKIVDNTYANPHFGGEFQPISSYPSTPSSPALSQIIMVSDRVNIEARSDSVLIAGFRDVKIGTKNWRMETDSTMGSIYELMQQTLILTQHVQEVAKQLDDTLAIMEKIQFPTGVGPTGPCLDPYFKEIGNVRGVLDTIRDDSKVRSDQYDLLLEQFGRQKRDNRDQKIAF